MLGRMILWPKETVQTATLFVQPDDFEDKLRKNIFEGIERLSAKRAPIETESLAQEVIPGHNDKRKLYLEIVDCCSTATSPSNTEHYSKIVADHAQFRRLNAATATALKATDTGEILRALETAVAASQPVDPSRPEPIGKIMARRYLELEAMADAGGPATMVTGIRALDERGGITPGELIILAARPGTGKTAMALQVADTVASHGKRVVLYSLEMGSAEVADRTYAEAGVDTDRLRTGILSDVAWSRLRTAVVSRENRKLDVVDSSGITLDRILATSMRAHLESPLDLIIIDYLQLIHVEGRRGWSREQEVAHISRELKGLARALPCPVIALAQLSRRVEQRDHKIPILSDLRESGALEQDADKVIFIHRPWLLDHTEDPKFCQIIMAKNRNGPTGKFDATFDAARGVFSD